MSFAFTTIVGRIVYGSVWERRKKTDKKGNAVLVKSGPNAGQQRESCDFGVAYPKVLANGAPNTPFLEWYKSVIDEARAGYPQFFTGPIDAFTGKPGNTHPRMSFKISDGDGVDGEGRPNNQKEGWAGHYVVHFSSNNPPRVFDINIGLDATQQLQDSSRVMPGDYVAVQGTCDANVGSETPGVYMNHQMVCFVGNGPRIVTGPKASDAFAGVMAGQMPPGCVPGATPATVAPAVSSPVVPAPVVPGVPTPPVAPVAHDPVTKATADGWVVHPSSPTHMYKGQQVLLIAEVAALYPAPVAAPTPPTVPAAPVPPVAPGIPAPPVAPVAPTKQLTPAAMAAGFTTYEAAIANHWTDDMLRAQGFLA
jgi:hypothetical protein